jgi:hypothetical protein
MIQMIKTIGSGRHLIISAKFKDPGNLEELQDKIQGIINAVFPDENPDVAVDAEWVKKITDLPEGGKNG